MPFREGGDPVASGAEEGPLTEDAIQESPEQAEVSEALRRIARAEDDGQSKLEEKPAQQGGEDGVDKKKQKIREAIEVILTEKRDLASLFRYAFLRPMRVIGTGSGLRKEKIRPSTSIVVDFCKKVGVPYPKTKEQAQELLERFDSSEFDQKIKNPVEVNDYQI